MGGGDSPGCPSRLNDAPDQGSAIEDVGVTLHLGHQTGSGTKKDGPLLGFFKCYSVTNPLLIPSQIFTDVTPDCTWTIFCPRCSNWIPFSCGCVEIPAFTCFLRFCHQLFLVTGNFQAGGLSPLMVTFTCTKLKSTLGIHLSPFGNSTCLTDIHR